jgi:hypothetical protein
MVIVTEHLGGQFDTASAFRAATEINDRNPFHGKDTLATRRFERSITLTEKQKRTTLSATIAIGGGMSILVEEESCLRPCNKSSCKLL